MTVINALRRSPLRWPILVAFVALGLIAIGFSSALSNAARATQSTGALTIDETTYDFAPTACTVTTDDFVVSGPGNQGDDAFFVTASSGSVELAFGIASEIDTPDASAMWLSSVEEVSWTNDDNVITAELLMIDRHDAEAGATDAQLTVNCSN